MLWRVNELVQRPSSVPSGERARFIAVLVIQLAAALAHWLGYAVVVGTQPSVTFAPLGSHDSPARPRSVVALGTPSLAHIEDDDPGSDTDTDEEDIIDPRLSRRASIASQALYVRARTVSTPSARHSSYGTLSARPRVSAPPPSA